MVTSHSGELALRSLRKFETWEPLLRTVREQNPDVARWAGAVGRGGAVVPRPDSASDSDRAELEAALLHLEGALAEARMWTVSFSVQYEADGRVEVRLAPASAPQVFDVPGSNTTGHIALVEHAQPEPQRRRPEVFPGLRAAPSADPELLEWTLRERLPDAVGATDADIAATENELGVELPDELKAVYRVTNAEHGGDWERFARESEMLGFTLLPLEELYFAAGVIERHSSLEDLATVAAVTRPTDAVQGVVAWTDPSKATTAGVPVSGRPRWSW